MLTLVWDNPTREKFSTDARPLPLLRQILDRFEKSTPIDLPQVDCHRDGVFSTVAAGQPILEEPFGWAGDGRIELGFAPWT